MPADFSFQPLTGKLLLEALPEPIEQADPLIVEMTRRPGWPGNLVTASEFSDALVDGGRAFAASGIVPQWPGRAVAWLVLSHLATEDHLGMALHMVCRSVDEAQALPTRWKRIEMTLRADLPWGDGFIKFARLNCEGVLRAFDPQGRDYKLVARIAGQSPAPDKTVH